jgi:hypothetical protein
MIKRVKLVGKTIKFAEKDLIFLNEAGINIHKICRLLLKVQVASSDMDIQQANFDLFIELVKNRDYIKEHLKSKKAKTK